MADPAAVATRSFAQAGALARLTPWVQVVREFARQRLQAAAIPGRLTPTVRL